MIKTTDGEEAAEEIKQLYNMKESGIEELLEEISNILSL